MKSSLHHLLSTVGICLLSLAPIIYTPRALADQFLYGNTASPSGQPNSLYSIDVSTGVASQPRSMGISYVVGIAYDSSAGQLFGLTTFASTPPNSLVRINITTGHTEAIGPTGLGGVFEGDIALNPVTGDLMGIQNVPGGSSRRELFSINKTTGAASVIGSISGTGDYSALAFSQDGTLYTIDTDANGGSVLHTLDASSAQILTTVPLSRDLGFTAGLAFHPETGVPYVADGGTNGTNNLYTLAANGNLNLVGSTGVAVGFAGLTFVPEPSSIFALLLFAPHFSRFRRLLEG